jgi:rfaE bifunctional protein nucleotidyltransferase chain/domain
MTRSPESKLVPWDRLERLSAELRAAGKRIVTTNGCFDIVHWGHMHYLDEARRLGDCLFVAVNADATVRRQKGEGRPINPESRRALQLAALESVDYVTVFPQETPEAFLETVRPAIHVKGGDYLPENLPERAVVERFGGEVRCLGFVTGLSTTKLIERMKGPRN